MTSFAPEVWTGEGWGVIEVLFNAGADLGTPDWAAETAMWRLLQGV